MSSVNTSASPDDVAIIGIAGRFPGAQNVQDFWHNLCDGVEGVTFFSDHELLEAGVPPETLNNPNYVKAHATLSGIEMFAASFFGIPPKEAEIMDPQQRLFLECAWEALENAGYAPEAHRKRVGVYAGVGANAYLLLTQYAPGHRPTSIDPYQSMISNEKDYLATRISYKLNLKGPGVTVQTACSTSLVAVHLACQSLLNGECAMALAGGVTIKIPQKAGYFYQEGGIVSPDGHCRAFDHRAQGTVGGDGVGAVVLKPLISALADRDTIHAVIRGSAINNDGGFKVGYTAPSVDGQAEVIAEAYLVAGVEPETITYIETHGTGTPLGDPIEVAALTHAFRKRTEKKSFCALGSVKTNIGHLDTAAGIAGLIKTTLALEHQLIPPSLHFEKPNPGIDFANSPFYVNAQLAQWRSNGSPRRAGVSSFGIGGTNAHVILEEAPAVEPSGESRPWQLLLLSARTPDALQTMTTNLVKCLKQQPHLELADVAYTLQVGRKGFEERLMLVAQDMEDAVHTLETLDPERVFTMAHLASERPVTFLFPGQGTQYVHMAQELYQSESLFRQQIDHCCDLLAPLLDLDLRAVLYPGKEQEAEAAQQLTQTGIAQSALFVVEYALARLWMSWGVQPQSLIGHSIGEYVAACLAGVLSLEDALRLVAARGQMMQQLPAGVMLAVSLSEERLLPLLDEHLSLAAVNGASRCVVSGPVDAISSLEQKLTREKIAHQRLQTSHAFHSEMVDPILDSFAEQVKQVTLQQPRIPYVSNVTGTWITGAEATDPGYWVRHLRQTVRFTEGLRTLLKEPGRILLEMGPGQTLARFARQHLDKNAEQLVFSSLPHKYSQGSDIKSLLSALGHLWLSGVEIAWPAFASGERRSRIPLPTYPFERGRYWLVPVSATYKNGAQQDAHFAEPISQAESAASVFRQNAHSIVPPSSVPTSRRHATIIFMLQEMFANLFGISQAEMDTRKTFFEMGADSLFLLLASQALRDKFDVNIPFRHLFDEYATIDRLAAYVDHELKSEDLLDEFPEIPSLEIHAPASESVTPLVELHPDKSQDGSSASDFQNRALNAKDTPGGSTTELEHVLERQIQAMQHLLATLRSTRSAPAKLASAGNEDGEFVAQIVRATVAELQNKGLLASAASPLAHIDSGENRAENTPPATSVNGSAPPQNTEIAPGVDGSGEDEIARIRTAPTTEAQKELWFLTQLGNDASLAYNQSMTLRMRGLLNVAALHKAVQELVHRHEVLRTTFSPQGDTQRILPTATIDIPCIDFSTQDEELCAAHALEWITKEAQRPFDLEHGPLLRIHLVKLTEQQHLLLFTYHHIIADGWSFGVLVQELSILYAANCQGTDYHLPQPLQCGAYAQWQIRQQQSPEMQAAESYWQKRFTTSSIPTLDLPTDRPRPSIKTYAGARESIVLNASLGNKLMRLSAEQNSTLFMLLLAAYNVLLFRLTGQDDIIVAILSAGQAPLGNAPLIGHCVNLLPLRSYIPGDPIFSDYLLSVKNDVLDAYDHQICSFSRLVKNLKLPRDPSRVPLVSTLFNLDRPDFPAFPGLDVELAINPTGYAKFDLAINITQLQDELHVTCDYNTNLFDASTIRRWLSHLETLLTNIAISPRQPLSHLPLLSESEVQHLLIERNATQMAYPKASCTHQLFEEQVGRTPDAVAVTFEQSFLTYQELNRRADQLAAYLREHGIRCGVRVGICMERSVEMLIALLGIFKAGGAFVPLDVAFPKERIAFMLEDSGAIMLLTQQKLLEYLPEHEEKGCSYNLVCLDRDWSIIEQSLSTDVAFEVSSENLAYIMYTSGSTGRPKGVLIPHYGFVNYLFWCAEAYGSAHGRGAPVQSSIAADAVFPNLFSPLLVGTAVFMLPESHALDALSTLLQEKAGFSLLKITPTQLEVLNLQLPKVDATKWVRTLVAGAEALRGDILDFWQTYAPTTILLNEYGPTETVVGCSIYRIPPGQSISGPVPIGLPSANIQFYVLDTQMQPVPIGVPGELYIGGDGLAWGYLNRPDLTAAVFVPHPFSSEPGSRLYKTGDIVRYLPDPAGNIEFIGRRDHQVKIKGYRVELGEVEAMLVGHPAVHQAAALVREDRPADKRLVAYIILHSGEELTGSELRDYMKDRLPEYMVPSAFVFLEVLPLTATGKIDLRALPAPERSKAEQEGDFVAPRTIYEKKLAEIWEQVLGIEHAGIHDNFFELGGDSIMSMQVVSLASKAGIQFTPRHMFQHQTIAELAAIPGITSAAQENLVPVTGPISPTPIQLRFFELDLLNPQHWNQTMLLQAKYPMNISYLTKALQAVLEHHDTLRIRAYRFGSSWRLVNAAPDDQIPFLTLDLTSLTEDEQARALTSTSTQLQASLNLANGPIVRSAFFTCNSDGTGRLLIIIHHLAVDTVSRRILLEDLQTAYTQLSNGQPIHLPPKTTSFQQWASLLNEYGRSIQLRKELNYWLAPARREIKTLPLDYPEASDANTEDSARIVSANMKIDETWALLQDIPRVFHIQTNEVLVTALVQAFARWTGEQALLVDLEGHGREVLFDGVELSRTVGWFTSLFPILLVYDDDSPEGALRSIKAQLRDIPDRGIGYGLLRYLSNDPEIAARLRNLPQAQVVFNYHGRATYTPSKDSSTLFALAPESCGPDRNPQDKRSYLLEIDMIVQDDLLHIYWTYSERIHRHASIATLAEYYREALSSLIRHCQFLESKGYAPSDFPETDVSPQELEAVFTALAEMEEGRDEKK